MSINSSTPTTGSSSTRKSFVYINDSYHQIYTNDPHRLSDAAIYANKRKYGVYSMPGFPTVGVPSKSSGTAAILAEKTDVSPKLWTPETSKTGLKAATLASSHPIDVKIWKPKLAPAAKTAALISRDKTVFPKEDRNTILEKGRGNANQAATAAHAVPAIDTARAAAPEAYAWGDRSKTISDAGLAASTYTHSKNGTGRAASLASSGSFASSSTFTQSSGLGDSTAPSNANMLRNLGNLEEIARKKANERLAKIYNPTSNTNIYAPRYGTPASNGGAAAAAAHISSEHESVRLAREREDAINAANQYEAVMNLARERAENRISQINQEVYYKNPLLNTQYYQEALAIAQEKGNARMENHGKIDIGGGKFMNQSDVDAIAERNVRPVLMEISEKALAQRQADEDRRLAEEEERKRVAEEKKILQDKKAEERRQVSEEKAAAKAIRKEEVAKQKAEIATQRNAERERRDAERKAAEEKKQQERAIADKKKSEERAQKADLRARQKAAKQELMEQRRKEKHTLKLAAQATAAAAAAAKEAEKLATAEVQKTNALVSQANAKLQAAKLAESEATNSLDVERAQADVAQAEDDLAAAQAAKEGAEDRKAEASAKKSEADAKVHDAVAAQKDMERKYQKDIADISKLDPTAISKEDLEEEDEKVDEEIRSILNTAEADVDAERTAKRGIYQNENASDASFATAEDDSIYSANIKSNSLVGKGKKGNKSSLDTENSKPKAIQQYPEPSAKGSTLPAQSALDEESVYNDDQSNYGTLTSAVPLASSSGHQTAEPDVLPLPAGSSNKVTETKKPANKNIDGETFEMLESVKYEDAVVATGAKTPGDGATINTNASVLSDPAPTPKPEVAKTGTSEAAAATTSKSAEKKKKGTSALFSKLKNAVYSKTSSSPTSSPAESSNNASAAAAAAAATKKTNTPSASTKPVSKATPSTTPKAVSSPAVAATPKNVTATKPHAKHHERTFSGFSQGGDEYEEEEEDIHQDDLTAPFKDHDSIVLVGPTKENVKYTAVAPLDTSATTPANKEIGEYDYVEDELDSPIDASLKYKTVDLAGVTADHSDTKRTASTSSSLAGEISSSAPRSSSAETREPYSMAPSAAYATTATVGHPSTAIATTVAIAEKQAGDSPEVDDAVVVDERRESEESQKGFLGKVIGSLVPGSSRKSSDSSTTGTKVTKDKDEEHYTPVFKEDVA